MRVVVGCRFRLFLVFLGFVLLPFGEASAAQKKPIFQRFIDEFLKSEEGSRTKQMQCENLILPATGILDIGPTALDIPTKEFAELPTRHSLSPMLPELQPEELLEKSESLSAFEPNKYPLPGPASQSTQRLKYSLKMESRQFSNGQRMGLLTYYRRVHLPHLDTIRTILRLGPDEQVKSILSPEAIAALPPIARTPKPRKSSSIVDLEPPHPNIKALKDSAASNAVQVFERNADVRSAADDTSKNIAQETENQSAPQKDPRLALIRRLPTASLPGYVAPEHLVDLGIDPAPPTLSITHARTGYTMALLQPFSLSESPGLDWHTEYFVMKGRVAARLIDVGVTPAGFSVWAEVLQNGNREVRKLSRDEMFSAEQWIHSPNHPPVPLRANEAVTRFELSRSNVESTLLEGFGDVSLMRIPRNRSALTLREAHQKQWRALENIDGTKKIINLEKLGAPNLKVGEIYSFVITDMGDFAMVKCLDLGRDSLDSYHLVLSEGRPVLAAGFITVSTPSNLKVMIESPDYHFAGVVPFKSENPAARPTYEEFKLNYLRSLVRGTRKAFAQFFEGYELDVHVNPGA